jgi:hypothetical protein
MCNGKTIDSLYKTKIGDVKLMNWLLLQFEQQIHEEQVYQT